MTVLFNLGENARIQQARQQLCLGYFNSAYMLLLICGLTVIVPGLVDFEYTVFREIYGYIKQALPGEEESMSANFLALTGCVALITFHIALSHSSQSFPERIVRWLVYLLTPVFLLGAGLLFAAMIYNDGGDSLFFGESDLSASIKNFLGGDNQLPPPLVTAIIEGSMPWFGLIFIAGLTGVSLFSIFSTHYAFVAWRSNIKAFTESRAKATRVKTIMAQLRDIEKQYTATILELALHEAHTNDRIAQESAHDIMLRLAQPVQIAEGWVAQKELNPGQDQETLIGSDPVLRVIGKFDLQVLKQRVDALRKIINEETILTIINKQRNSYE